MWDFGEEEYEDPSAVGELSSLTVLTPSIMGNAPRSVNITLTAFNNVSAETIFASVSILPVPIVNLTVR